MDARAAPKKKKRDRVTSCAMNEEILNGYSHSVFVGPLKSTREKRGSTRHMLCRDLDGNANTWIRYLKHVTSLNEPLLMGFSFSG